MASSAPRPGARGVTLWGAVVNLALCGVKLVVGLWGNSQALVADAVHSLSDLGSDAVVLWGVARGRAPADADHNFGHGRLETLAAALVGLVLAATAVGIGWRAAQDVIAGGGETPRLAVLAVAALSVAAKEWLFLWTRAAGRRLNSPALIANAWHHRTDALSSVAVLIGAGAAWFNPAWAVADAWAALAVALMILLAAVKVLRDAVAELTDTAPSQEVQETLAMCARGVPGVREVHDLKVRGAGGRFMMEVHVVVDGDLSVRQGHAIAKEVERCLLEEDPRVVGVTVHVDPE